MGVDAKMYYATNMPCDAETLRKLAYRLANAVGPEVFGHHRWDDGKDGFEPSPCLQLWEQRDGDSQPITLPLDGLSLVEVHLSGRYYGEHYERGNPWNFIATAQWIERNVPGAIVFYGGDSSNQCDAFGPCEREALIAHWAKVGGLPYETAFDRDGFAPAECRPVSAAYDEPMIRNGWGKSYAAFYCPASGEERVWNDGQWVKGGAP